MSTKQEETKVIAQRVAKQHGRDIPNVFDWEEAQELWKQFDAVRPIITQPEAVPDEDHGHYLPPAPAAEEPSYMMFARSNVRDGAQTSPTIVNELLKRIDRLEKATEVVKAAWTNAGPVPEYHQKAQQRLLKEWPTLANAVEGLVK